MSKSNAKAAAERLKNQSVIIEQASEITSEDQQSELENSDDSSSKQSEANTTEEKKEMNDETVVKVALKLVQVEFTGPYKRYSKGDVAAFSEKVSTELIAKKVAVFPGKSVESNLDPV